MSRALEEARAEKERREALQADLAALREKYSALKRRFVDAGRKVSPACNSRAEAVDNDNDALPLPAEHMRSFTNEKCATGPAYCTAQQYR